MNLRTAGLLLGLLGVGRLACAAPFDYIRIGDVDGFGYGAAAGFNGADGNPAQRVGSGILDAGDLLPDINGNGVTATSQGDEFDLRDASEQADTKFQGSGYTNVGSFGSHYTDISLARSYDARSAANQVYIGGGFGAGGAFPDGNSNALPNQPGFRFRMNVLGGDIVAGTPLFFNLVYGDYDVRPATVRLRRADMTTTVIPINVQPPALDGLVQQASLPLSFFDVFTAVGPDWSGYLDVDFLAPDEPYTAFDYVELSLRPLETIPEPGTLGLLLAGAVAISRRRRR